MIPAVCFENVSFSYGKHLILEEVDLDLPIKALSCVVGPNGGGKTTLLRLMLGLLKPNKGHVHIFGKSPEAQRDCIGYVPQHLRFDLQFPVTVQDVVLMALVGKRKLGWYRKKDKQAAGEALEKVGLEELRDKKFADLSGGQRQRVLIARALVGDPQLLLLDEPAANIDPQNAEKLYETLGLIKETIACVLVSHELEFVTSLAEQVVCVHRTVEMHPTEEFECSEIDKFLGTKLRRVVHTQHLPSTEHNHEH